MALAAGVDVRLVGGFCSGDGELSDAKTSLASSSSSTLLRRPRVGIVGSFFNSVGGVVSLVDQWRWMVQASDNNLSAM